MNYFTSAPVPANQVPVEIMSGINKVHGSYDVYNKKLSATVNTESQIKVFESVVSEELLWSLYDTNVTLYSSSEAAKVMAGGTIGPKLTELAAIATKVNGIIYIAIDIDPIVSSIENEGGVTGRLSSLIESIVEHEMVHVMQMERGDLDFTAEGVLWKNRLYSNDFLDKSAAAAAKSKDPFAGIKQQVLLPWEVEAYAVSLMEVDLDTMFDAQTAKVMYKARKQYLSSINHASRRA